MFNKALKRNLAITELGITKLKVTFELKMLL